VPRTTLGELTALPKPIAGGMWRGLAAPPENPTPVSALWASGFDPSGLASLVPTPKLVQMPLQPTKAA